jgi:hypothetical protein
MRMLQGRLAEKNEEFGTGPSPLQVWSKDAYWTDESSSGIFTLP